MLQLEDLSLMTNWSPLESLYRLTHALGIGLFIGIEREWRGKSAGLRTFGFVSLLGGMGGMLGQTYAITCMALFGVLIVIMNWQAIKTTQGAEVTTSAALLVTGMTGILCGMGHAVTPTAVGVVTAGLLAWKERLAIFSHKLTAEEVRAEILLAILTFAIYPILPTHAIDPWGLIVPRAAWMTVILIASIGFINYVLWKAYGEDGIEMTGFLGGLVNSTVTVTELSNRVRESKGRLLEVAYRGVLLATAAMSVRNGVILGVLALSALKASLIPLVLILITCGFFVLLSKFRGAALRGADSSGLQLQTPFSLMSALKFGLIFLIMEMTGTAAHELLGRFGFYAVSIAGGFISSASAVASAATLVSHGKLTPMVGGTGAILASLASAAINIVIVSRFSRNHDLTRRLAKVLILSILLAIGAAACQTIWPFG